MDSLFSHAPRGDDEPAGDDAGTPPARHHEVLLPVAPEQAFEGFTEYLHLWWPVARYSAFGSGTHPAFEDGVVAEEGEDGRRYVWATVEDFTVPTRLSLSFQMALEQHPPSALVLAFQAEGDGSTRMVLDHAGWAGGAAGWEQYRKYDGWPEILGYYARFMGGGAVE
ncbi:SRPBCC domain-containing protein [Zafaria sp. Z1313]|uniref:SRPBCC domain-containing protein n=1 Tax=unclassified Zafaria TaxID=2828765 RepID=UPI002E7907ED|nr:SRPBCC domain-containing protein [Zafaria sp. J156]MEE1622413.1 SRPBCC domain-containing protein [Zafaria sp. J156]